MLLAFWLCVHLERLEIAQYLMSLDTIIDKIISNIKKSSESISKPGKSKRGPAASSQGDSEDSKFVLTKVSDLTELKE